MIEYLDQYDKSLMLILNFDGGAWLDAFWYTYSGKFIWVGVYICILWKFYLCCRRQPQKWLSLLWLVIATALLITLCDQVASGLIKPLVERPRPSHSVDIETMLHYVNGYRGGSYGFISSHAANSIGLAVWLCLLFRAKIFRYTIIFWSIFTCYSRIYLGVHYPGDIAGGLTVGILSAFLLHYLYRRFVPKTQQIAVERDEPWLITYSIFATIVVILVWIF